MAFGLSDKELAELQNLLQLRRNQVADISEWLFHLPTDQQEEVEEDPLEFSAIKEFEKNNQAINRWIRHAFDDQDRSLYHDEKGLSQLGAPMLAFNEMKYDPEKMLPGWPWWEDLMLDTFDDTGSIHDLLDDGHVLALERMASSPYPPLTAAQRKRLVTMAVQAQELSRRLLDIAESR